ncbi:nose resistant to fluoxetine protein 6 [Uranotaenia lowii]|uniref:nose resistant to fluoxetine protein 6 n=1 Tax=Uranotaenia lowii TaxID=190385 RepID=UPI002478EE9C|nr:nose resistant to fluoxetine protein 6 [Uranotaenia lowii]
MHVSGLITILGIAVTASNCLEEGNLHQCDGQLEQCSLNDRQSSNSQENNGTKKKSPTSWSFLLGGNRTLPGSVNLSDINEYNVISRVKRRIDAEIATNDSFAENEDSLKIAAHEAEFVSQLSAKFFSVHSPFNPAYSSQVSETCKRSSKAYLQALQSLEMWALRMHDASGKLTSGILNGNINQYGDYDQCVAIRAAAAKGDSEEGHEGETVDPLQGRYCLAGIQPTVAVPDTVLLKHLYNLVQSHGMIKSQLDDPGHRVPRFSTINWALCVPAGCSAQDIQLSLREFLQDLGEGTGVQLDVAVEPELCEVKNSIWTRYFTDNTLKVWSGFVVYLIVVLLSTAYEYKSTRKNKWLTSFSLIRNTRSIFCVKEDPNDVSCVHGIRFLNALLLVIAHKSMALFFNPYVNRTDMSETLGQPWTVVGRAASIFTDPFIMFSGFLTTYSLVGRLMRGQRIQLHQEFLGRILRIAPPLGALILFCTFVLPFLGSGPQWNLVITNHGDICKKYWWRNMIYIHNYFGFKNMCLTHTHHVGIDTELFLASPLFIWLIWKWPRKGAAALVVLALVTTAHRFYVTYKLRLSNYVYFGTSVKQLFDTADHMYILPYHRLTVYLMGVMLGYACRVYKSTRLTPNQLRWGWYASWLLLMVAFFGPAPMGSMHYVYDPLHAANYAAFSPIAWCIFFAWAVFTSHLGYRNKLTDLFSWRGFRVTTKISYAVYLTQFPIFFYNVGRVRNAQLFNFITSVLFDFNEYGVIFIASFLLTVLFESPFSNIKKLLFDNKRRAAAKHPSTTTTPVNSTAESTEETSGKQAFDINENSNKTVHYHPSDQVKDLNE